MPMLYSMGYPPKKVKKPKHFLLDSRSFAVPHSGRGGGGGGLGYIFAGIVPLASQNAHLIQERMSSFSLASS